MGQDVGQNAIHIQDEQLTIGQLTLPLQLKRGRKGRIRIGFKDDTLWVETPNGKLGSFDLHFLRKKAPWITKHYSKQQTKLKAQRALKLNADKYVRLFGKTVPLRFEQDERLHFKYSKHELLIYITPMHRSHLGLCSVAVLKQIARRYLIDRTRELAAFCKLDVNAVRVKSHKTKWGSCSSKKNINLNWHLILLEKDLIDYVIIHELMHLKRMDHSPAYWELVSAYLPNYRALIKRIKEEEWIIGTYD